MGKITDSIKNEVKESVYDFFAEECEVDISKLNDKTSVIKDLEGDSLMFLQLLEVFKRKYNLNLELKTIGKYVIKHPVETIGGIIDMTLLIIEHEDKIAEMD